MTWSEIGLQTVLMECFSLLRVSVEDQAMAKSARLTVKLAELKGIRFIRTDVLGKSNVVLVDCNACTTHTSL